MPAWCGRRFPISLRADGSSSRIAILMRPARVRLGPRLLRFIFLLIRKRAPVIGLPTPWNGCGRPDLNESSNWNAPPSSRGSSLSRPDASPMNRRTEAPVVRYKGYDDGLVTQSRVLWDVCDCGSRSQSNNGDPVHGPLHHRMD